MKKIFKIFCFVLAICSINVNIVNAENNNSVMLWKVFQSKRAWLYSKSRSTCWCYNIYGDGLYTHGQRRYVLGITRSIL